MSSEDGPWLDMSVYPDTDPDAVLSAEAQSEVHEALVAAAGPLPEDTWQQMIATAVGETNDESPEFATPEHSGGNWALDGEQDSFVEGLGDEDLDFHADHGTHDAPFIDVVPTSDSEFW
jgi:hypothetical protein